MDLAAVALLMVIALVVGAIIGGWSVYANVRGAVALVLIRHRRLRR